MYRGIHMRNLLSHLPQSHIGLPVFVAGKQQTPLSHRPGRTQQSTHILIRHCKQHIPFLLQIIRIQIATRLKRRCQLELLVFPYRVVRPIGSKNQIIRSRHEDRIIVVIQIKSNLLPRPGSQTEEINVRITVISSAQRQHPAIGRERETVHFVKSVQIIPLGMAVDPTPFKPSPPSPFHLVNKQSSPPLVFAHHSQLFSIRMETQQRKRIIRIVIDSRSCPENAETPHRIHCLQIHLGPAYLIRHEGRFLSLRIQYKTIVNMVHLIDPFQNMGSHSRIPNHTQTIAIHVIIAPKPNQVLELDADRDFKSLVDPTFGCHYAHATGNRFRTIFLSYEIPEAMPGKHSFLALQ